MQARMNPVPVREKRIEESFMAGKMTLNLGTTLHTRPGSAINILNYTLRIRGVYFIEKLFKKGYN